MLILQGVTNQRNEYSAQASGTGKVQYRLSLILAEAVETWRH
jgi:hypothetical protein